MIFIVSVEKLHVVFIEQLTFEHFFPKSKTTYDSPLFQHEDALFSKKTIDYWRLFKTTNRKLGY